MAHTSLVAGKGSEVDRLLAVILREGLYLGAVLGNTPLGGEGHGPMAGGTELTMRLKGRNRCYTLHWNINIAINILARKTLTRRNTLTKRNVLRGRNIQAEINTCYTQEMNRRKLIGRGY